MPQQPAPSDEIIPAAPASVIHELKYIDLLLLKTLAETESLTKTSARIGISVAKASRCFRRFANFLIMNSSSDAARA